MKLKITTVAALAALAIAGSANAAVVVWGSSIAITLTGIEATEAPQIINQGTTGATYHNGAGGTSNGVTFASSNGTITLTEAGATTGNWAISPPGGPYPTAFQGVIAGYHYGTAMTYTASNLTPGQEYLVQFLNWNTNAATITSGNTSPSIDDQYVTGTFTADVSGSQVFSINNGGGINAAQIRVIPEPSAALLGGLGLLALLRRRRA